MAEKQRKKTPMSEEQRQRRSEYFKKERRRKKRQRAMMMRLAVLGVLLVVLAGGIVGVSLKVKQAQQKKEEERARQELLIREEEERNQRKKDIIAQAEKMVLGYDYEGAIELLKTIENYDKDGTVLAKIAGMEAEKSNLTAVSMSQVTHIYFYSLIVDTKLAFAGNDNTAANFKQWMATVDEFKNVIQEMYDNGYVLVSVYDLVKQTVDENGEVHFSSNTIYLPDGKIPYVLSLEDLSYHHSYEGRGIASKLVLDANGDVTCEYVQEDGSVVTGAYDCVPILEQFLKEHPDAAYKGAKGTITLTGYEGILGYRTDIAYKTGENLGNYQKAWLDAHPDFNWEQECEDAKKIADVLKANGWTFASNTWGQVAVGSASLERIQADTEKWKMYVEPLVGETDIIAFYRGQDIGDWRNYTMENEKFQYLKSKGYNFFFNVDSSQYFQQIQDNYVRQGRRSIDGYRLWNDVHGTKNRTSDLFNAATVLDPARTDMPGV